MATAATAPTLAGTPFAAVKYFDGTAASTSVVTGLAPTHAKKFNTAADALQNDITTSTCREGLDVGSFDPRTPAVWKSPKSNLMGKSSRSLLRMVPVQ